MLLASHPPRLSRLSLQQILKLDSNSNLIFNSQVPKHEKANLFQFELLKSVMRIRIHCDPYLIYNNFHENFLSVLKISKTFISS